MPRRALSLIAALSLAAPALALATPAAPAGAAPTTVAPASPLCTARAQPPKVGLTLLKSAAVAGHPRVTDLTFASKALNGDVHVDVLLPHGYDPAASTRYPVLYLLHGHGGTYRDWVQNGVESSIGSAPVIVVMPDGGYDGFYTDWYGSDIDGHTPNPPPAWESFHLRELLPWVDRTYKTVATRQGRAIAGLSMGGFGSMSYAARHPDLFVAAGSFSGAVDTDIGWPIGSAAVGAAVNLPDAKPPDNCIWGDPATQDVAWRDHDPTELAGNLRGMSLFMASGNGFPGRYDDPSHLNVGAQALEGGVYYMNQAFDSALTQDRIAHTTDFYGGGSHTWPYWAADLQRFVPQMMAAFAKPAAAPPHRGFDYETADAQFSVWGWTFTPRRLVTEMTYLHDVGSRGFDVAGSGGVHVDTAPLYRPGVTYRLVGAGLKPMKAKADRDGRLHFDVYLGLPHHVQQLAFGATAESTFYHAHVLILRA